MNFLLNLAKCILQLSHVFVCNPRYVFMPFWHWFSLQTTGIGFFMPPNVDIRRKNYTYGSRGNSFFHHTSSLVFIQFFFFFKKQSCEGWCHSSGTNTILKVQYWYQQWKFWYCNNPIDYKSKSCKIMLKKNVIPYFELFHMHRWYKCIPSQKENLIKGQNT